MGSDFFNLLRPPRARGSHQSMNCFEPRKKYVTSATCPHLWSAGSSSPTLTPCPTLKGLQCPPPVNGRPDAASRTPHQHLGKIGVESFEGLSRDAEIQSGPLRADWCFYVVCVCERSAALDPAWNHSPSGRPAFGPETLQTSNYSLVLLIQLSLLSFDLFVNSFGELLRTEPAVQLVLFVWVTSDSLFQRANRKTAPNSKWPRGASTCLCSVILDDGITWNCFTLLFFSPFPYLSSSCAFCFNSIQDIATLFNLIIILLMLFNTYVFQVGLVAVLLERFRSLLMLSALYLTFSIILHSWLMVRSRHQTNLHFCARQSFWSLPYESK